MNDLAQQIQIVKQRIEMAARKAGRTPDSVRLLAVTKGIAVDRLKQAVATGLLELGENYLQEARTKIAQVQHPALQWHYIGRVQSNKTTAIARHFHWLHTLTSARHAERLSSSRPPSMPPLNVCLQLHPGGDSSHNGLSTAAVQPLAERVSHLPGLRLRGLMVLPEPAQSAEAFALACRQFQQLQLQWPMLDSLSMGMSNDLEQAVAAGATWLRIGTALFGSRTPNQ